MSYQFNVLNDPWMPVVYKDGSFKEVSALQAVKDADSIYRVACENPIDNTSITRFLLSLLYWVEGSPKGRQSLPNTFATELSKRDGFFNLFGTGKRFLQVENHESLWVKVGTKKILNNIKYLISELSTGTNTTFFNNSPDSSGQLCPKSIVIGLLRLNAFAITGGRTTKKDRHINGRFFQESEWGSKNNCINGSNSIYAIPVGASLSDTLRLMWKDCDNIGKPIWEDHQSHLTDGEVPLLLGMTFIPRTIYLRDPEEGTCSHTGKKGYVVRNMIYEGNPEVKSSYTWKDPHILFKDKDEEQIEISKPSKDKEDGDRGAVNTQRKGCCVTSPVIKLTGDKEYGAKIQGPTHDLIHVVKHLLSDNHWHEFAGRDMYITCLACKEALPMSSIEHTFHVPADDDLRRRVSTFLNRWADNTISIFKKLGKLDLANRKHPEKDINPKGKKEDVVEAMRIRFEPAMVAQLLGLYDEISRDDWSRYEEVMQSHDDMIKNAIMTIAPSQRTLHSIKRSIAGSASFKNILLEDDAAKQRLNFFSGYRNGDMSLIEEQAAIFVDNLSNLETHEIARVKKSSWKDLGNDPLLFRIFQSVLSGVDKDRDRTDVKQLKKWPMWLVLRLYANHYAPYQKGAPTFVDLMSNVKSKHAQGKSGSYDARMDAIVLAKNFSNMEPHIMWAFREISRCQNRSFDWQSLVIDLSDWSDATKSSWINLYQHQPTTLTEGV